MYNFGASSTEKERKSDRKKTVPDKTVLHLASAFLAFFPLVQRRLATTVVITTNGNNLHLHTTICQVHKYILQYFYLELLRKPTT